MAHAPWGASRYRHRLAQLVRRTAAAFEPGGTVSQPALSALPRKKEDASAEILRLVACAPERKPVQINRGTAKVCRFHSERLLYLANRIYADAGLVKLELQAHKACCAATENSSLSSARERLGEGGLPSALNLKNAILFSQCRVQEG